MNYFSTVSSSFKSNTVTDMSVLDVCMIAIPYHAWVEQTEARRYGFIQDSIRDVIFELGDLNVAIVGTSNSDGWLIDYLHYLPPMQFVSSVSAQRLEDAKVAKQEIERFTDLQEDWDGYGAAAITNKVRNNALHFIRVIEDSLNGLPIPEISPTTSGTIAFEWESGKTYAYMEIGSTRYSGYVGSEKQNPTYLQGRVESLDQRVVADLQKYIAASVEPTPSITDIFRQRAIYELVVP